MNRTSSVVPNLNDMKLHHRTIPGSHSSVAAVRTLIEQEFSSLHWQHPRLFRLALNEAEALAWQTGFPQLFFPLLAREKALALAVWHSRQQAIRRSEPCLSFAA